MPVVLMTAVVALLAANAPAAEKAESGAIDPQASDLLQRMCRLLQQTKNFQVEGDSSLEAVLSTGQRVQYNASSLVSVSRPAKLRSERMGAPSDLTFVYDGKSFWLYDKRANAYATTKAPPNIDGAIDAAREKLDLDAPGADLLYSNACEGLLDGVTSLRNVGLEAVEGTVAHHLVARKKDTDWQLWIESGDQPLPRKYVITSTDVPQAPQFEVMLRNWNLKPNFKPDYFAFQPPAKAQRIDFLQNRERAVGGTGADDTKEKTP